MQFYSKIILCVSSIMRNTLQEHVQNTILIRTNAETEDSFANFPSEHIYNCI